MPIKKESVFKVLRNLSIVTGTVSIAFIVSIALIMSGVNKLLSIAVSLGISILYLLYRIVTIEMIEP